MTTDFHHFSLETLDLLILTRLLIPATETKTRDDLAKIVAARLTPGEWATSFDSHWRRLVQAELVVRKPAKTPSKSFCLADAGRERVRHFLQIEQLPAKITWAAIQADLLLPLAMKVRPASPEGKQLKKPGPLKLAVIARSKQLPLGEGAKAKTLLAALAWKLIGVESQAEFTAENVIQQLALHQRPSKRLTTEQAAAALAASAVGARNKTLPELRLATLRQWLVPFSEDSQPAAAPRSDLSTFAGQAIDAARRCPAEGRFGESKVFISHVWRQLRNEPAGAGLDLGRFKQRLVEANRDGLLQLSRADLVEAMNPTDVRESATVYDNATFHFVRL